MTHGASLVTDVVDWSLEVRFVSGEKLETNLCVVENGLKSVDVGFISG